jgi:uncharacterized membrane protein YhaH (DUF805 family)
MGTADFTWLIAITAAMGTADFTWLIAVTAALGTADFTWLIAITAAMGTAALIPAAVFQCVRGPNRYTKLKPSCTNMPATQRTFTLLHYSNLLM